MFIKHVFCLIVIHHLTFEGALAVRCPAEISQPNQEWLPEVNMPQGHKELARKFEVRGTTPVTNEETDMDDYVEVIDKIPLQTNLYKSPRNSKTFNVVALSKNKPLGDRKFPSEMSLNVESTIRMLKNQLDQEKQKVEKLSHQLNQAKYASMLVQGSDFNSRPVDFALNGAPRRVSNKTKVLKSTPKGERQYYGNRQLYRDDDKFRFNPPKYDWNRFNRNRSYLMDGYFDNEHLNSELYPMQQPDYKLFRKEDIMNKLYPLMFNDDLKAKARMPLDVEEHSRNTVMRDKPADIYLSHMKKLTAPYDVFPMKTNPKTRYMGVKNRKRGAETEEQETAKKAKTGDESKGDEQSEANEQGVFTMSSEKTGTEEPSTMCQMKHLSSDEEAESGETPKKTALSTENRPATLTKGYIGAIHPFVGKKDMNKDEIKAEIILNGDKTLVSIHKKLTTLPEDTATLIDIILATGKPSI